MGNSSPLAVPLVKDPRSGKGVEYVGCRHSQLPIGSMILVGATSVRRAYPMSTYFQPLERAFPSRKDVLVHEQVVLPLICPCHIEHDVDKLFVKGTVRLQRD
jgi:hypothetical protein